MRCSEARTRLTSNCPNSLKPSKRDVLNAASQTLSSLDPQPQRFALLLFFSSLLLSTNDVVKRCWEAGGKPFNIHLDGGGTSGPPEPRPSTALLMSRMREAGSSFGQTADLHDDHLRKQMYGPDLVLFCCTLGGGATHFPGKIAVSWLKESCANTTPICSSARDVFGGEKLVFQF